MSNKHMAQVTLDLTMSQPIDKEIHKELLRFIQSNKLHVNRNNTVTKVMAQAKIKY
jgi:hypothetical protein